MKIIKRLAAALAVTVIGNAINIPSLKIQVPFIETVKAAEVGTIQVDYNSEKTSYAKVSYDANGIPTYDFSQITTIDWNQLDEFTDTNRYLFPINKVWVKPTEQQFIDKIRTREGKDFPILYYDPSQYTSITSFLKENNTSSSFALIIKEGTTQLSGFNSYETGCANLENVKYAYIPESVTTVSDPKFFSGLTNLKEVILSSKTTKYSNQDTQESNGIVSYGKSPFSDTPNLEQMVIPPTVTEFCKNIKKCGLGYWIATDQSDYITATYNFPNLKYKPNIKEVKANAVLPVYFIGNTPNMKSVTIPDGITEINYGAFADSGIKEIKFPTSCKKIGRMAFSNTLSLEKIDFGNSPAIEIAEYAFANSAVKQVNLPSNLSKLEKGVFQNCAQLSRITIPATCLEIGADVFKGCTSLEEIIIDGDDVKIDDTALPAEKNYTIYTSSTSNKLKESLEAKGYTVKFKDEHVDKDKVSPTVEVGINYDDAKNKATLTAKGKDNLTVADNLLYSIDSTDEKDFKSEAIFEISKNATYTIYCKDEAGNIGQKEIKVECIIDQIEPEISNIQVQLSEDKLSANLIINATDNQTEVSKLTYSINGKDYQDSNTFKVLKNKTYTIYCKDEASNVKEKIVEVNGIKDVTKPIISKVNIAYSDTQLSAEIEIIASDNQTDEENLLYSIDNVSYSKGNKFAINKNGTYKIYCKDEAGLISEPYEIAITQIKDNVSPVINEKIELKYRIDPSSPTGTKYPKGDSFSYADITIDATDDRTDVSQLSYSCDGENYQSSNVIRIYENGTYYIRCKDSSGNVSEAKQVVVDKIGRKCGIKLKEGSGFVTNYRKGETSFKAGGTLIVTQAEETEEIPITVEMLSGPSTSSATKTLSTGGIKKVTITYEGETTTQDISVKELTSIALNEGTGFKKIYEVNEAFDPTGTILATYSDGTISETEEVVLGSSNCETVDLTTTGEKEVTVKYTAGGNKVTTKYKITVRDSQKPVISSVAKQKIIGENKVRLTATATDQHTAVGSLQYAINGGAYQSSNIFEVVSNGNYSITCKDEAGNVSEGYSIAVTEITDDPVISNVAITYDEPDYTYANLTITAVDNDTPAGELRYSKDNVNYQANNQLKIYTNGTYYVRCKDKDGNVSEEYKIVVDKIGKQGGDTEKPVISTVDKAYNETDNEVTLTVTASDNRTEVGSLKYALNGGSYQSSNTFKIVSNGTYTITCQDEAGNESEMSNVTITEIKEDPEITKAEVSYDADYSYATLTITAKDNNTAVEELRYSKDGNNYQVSNQLKIYNNGTYYVRCKDKDGNVSEEYKIVVDKIGRKCGIELKTGSGFVTNYRKGETSFKAGGTLIVTTDENVTEVPITVDMIKGEAADAATTLGVAGIKTVTITYDGKSTTQKISVKELTGIEIKEGSGIKTTYEVKEAFDTTGKIIATYSDGTISETEEVELASTSHTDVDMSTTGEKDVTVSYTAGDDTKETTYKIIVRDSQKPKISVVGKKHDIDNNKVTLTVTATDNYTDVGDLQYAINGGTYQSSNIFEVMSNGNYNITCKDEAGNVSEVYSVAVTEITDDPVISNVAVTYDAPSYTCATLTITATDNDTPANELKYSKDGINYQSSNVIKVYENGTYMIRCKDKNGNVSEDYKVEIKRLGRKEGLEVKESSGFVINYTKGETDFKAGGVLIVTTNENVTEVPITADMIKGPSGADATTTLGTAGIKTVTIDYNGQTVTQNIVVKETSAPKDPEIKDVQVEYDTQDYNYAILTIIAEDEDTQAGDLRYSKDGSNYQVSNEIKVYENGTYYIKCKDKDGNVSQDYRVEVTELDHIAPEIEFVYDAGDLTKVIIKVTDAHLDKLVMPNGVEYPADGATSIEQVFDATAINGSFIAYDTRGNEAKKQFNVKVVEEVSTASTYLAEVGIPENWSNEDANISVMAVNNEEEVQLSMPHDSAEQGASIVNESTLGFTEVDVNTIVTTSAAVGVEHEEDNKESQETPIVGFAQNMLVEEKKRSSAKKYWDQKTITLANNALLEYTITGSLGTVTETLAITKIDKELPVLSLDIHNNGDAVQVSYVATDQLSGIKNIYLSNGEVIDIDHEEESTVKGNISILEEGDYKIVVKDYAGNVAEKYFNIPRKQVEKPADTDKKEEGSTAGSGQLGAITVVPSVNESSNSMNSDSTNTNVAQTESTAAEKVETKKEVSVEELVGQAIESNQNPNIKLEKEGKLDIDRSIIEKVMQSNLALNISRENMTLELTPEFISNILLATDKILEIQLSPLEKAMSEVVKESLKKQTDLKEVSNLGIISEIKVKGNKEITQFIEPLSVKINLKDAAIDEKMHLTFVRYEKQEDGSIKIIKLGGTYNKEEKVFETQMDQPGIYGMLQCNELTQINLGVGEKNMMINGKEVENDVAPIINNNRVMLPLRFVAENLNCEVKWNALTKQVTIISSDKTLNLKMGQIIEEYGVAPIIQDGRVLVPIRYISEALGSNVIWVPSTKSVRIIK